MTVRIDIENAELDELSRFLENIGRGDILERASVQELDRAARKVRTQSAKVIRENLGLKSSTIKKTIELVPAKQTAFGLASAAIIVSGKPLPLNRFSARSRKGQGPHAQGVSVIVKRARGRFHPGPAGRKVFRSVHLGGEGQFGRPIFQRFKGSRRIGRKFGPSVPAVFAGPDRLIDIVLRGVPEDIASRMAGRVRFLLTRFRL